MATTRAICAEFRGRGGFGAILSMIGYLVLNHNAHRVHTRSALASPTDETAEAAEAAEAEVEAEAY